MTLPICAANPACMALSSLAAGEILEPLEMTFDHPGPSRAGGRVATLGGMGLRNIGADDRAGEPEAADRIRCLGSQRHRLDSYAA